MVVWKGHTKLIIQRCFGAASAKDRLDVVIRDAINAGDIPGPRYLANGKEMARRVCQLDSYNVYIVVEHSWPFPQRSQEQFMNIADSKIARTEILLLALLLMLMVRTK